MSTGQSRGADVLEALQAAVAALVNLHAMVEGECPSLLEDWHGEIQARNAIEQGRSALSGSASGGGDGTGATTFDRWDAYHVQLASHCLRDLGTVSGSLVASVDRESLADDLARIASKIRSPVAGAPLEPGPVGYARAGDVGALRTIEQDGGSCFVPIWWAPEGSRVRDEFTVPLYLRPAPAGEEKP